MKNSLFSPTKLGGVIFMRRELFFATSFFYYSQMYRQNVTMIFINENRFITFTCNMAMLQDDQDTISIKGRPKII